MVIVESFLTKRTLNYGFLTLWGTFHGVCYQPLVYNLMRHQTTTSYFYYDADITCNNHYIPF
jgi:hypothetical protein